SSRYRRQRWHEITARHIERLFRPVPLGAISFLDSSRWLRCCPALELADGRRVTSRPGSAAVRIDDVQLHQTRDSQVRWGTCVTEQDVGVLILNIEQCATTAVGVLIAAPTRDLTFRTNR